MLWHETVKTFRCPFCFFSVCKEYNWKSAKRRVRIWKKCPIYIVYFFNESVDRGDLSKCEGITEVCSSLFFCIQFCASAEDCNAHNESKTESYRLSDKLMNRCDWNVSDDLLMSFLPFRMKIYDILISQFNISLCSKANFDDRPDSL